MTRRRLISIVTGLAVLAAVLRSLTAPEPATSPVRASAAAEAKDDDGASSCGDVVTVGGETSWCGTSPPWGHTAVEVTVSRIDNRLLLTRSNTAPHSMLVPGS